MDEQMSENQSPEEKSPQEEPIPPSEQLPEVEGLIQDDQKIPEPQPMGKFKRYGLFAAGFLGWFLVNGLVWLLISRGEMNLEEQEGMVFINALCVLPLNLAIMLLLLWKKFTRMISLGILTAYGVNLIISLILGLSTNAACLIPFFEQWAEPF